MAAKLTMFAVFAVVLAVGLSDAVPLHGIDPFCQSPAPLADSTCAVTGKAWTYDLQQKGCVEVTACQDAAIPDNNLFPSQHGCYLWCNMIYE